MQRKGHISKLKERGYLVVAGIFFVLMMTVVVGLGCFLYVVKLNYNIALINNELAVQGYYSSIQPLVPDFSIFNWAITAESAAFSVAAAAQASKKKSNNNFQYAEEWLDKWFGDAEMRPYITQVIQSYLMANPNNN